MKSTLSLLFVLSQLVIHAHNNVIDEIVASKTLLWGPGLRPEDITMRARYVFLQLRDRDGRK